MRNIWMRKLKGALLLESLIAMVIVMTAFGVSALIFDRVLEGGYGEMRTKAEFELKKMAAAMNSNHDFLDGTLDMNGFTIEKKIFPYGDNTQVYQMKLIAKDPNGKLLAQYEELIYNP